MQLGILTSTSARIAATRSRRQKVELLSDCLQQLDPQEIPIAVAYLMGSLPQGKIGLGYASIKSIQTEPVQRLSLTLSATDAIFQRISEQQGGGSKRQRQQLLVGLLQRATHEEQSFLRRLILGELRQGALEAVMVEAIAAATALSIDRVRRAVMLSGDPAEVASAALLLGQSGLAGFSLRLFRPVKPMLAQTAEDSREVFSRFGQAALEYKLDGARIQVHKSGDEIRVFTRQLNEVTASVPELVEVIDQLPVSSIILDGEAIALDGAQRPLPFQVSMRRFGRRLNLNEMRKRIPLSAFYFDCLHLDGTDLIDQPDLQRNQVLTSVLSDDLRVPRLITNQEQAANSFLQRALTGGHEGIMVKSLQATYQAGNRGAEWFKIKPAHTLDLVILAAEWGSGRRQGRLSNLHLGARDAESNRFVMLGKTFKGLTDAMLDWQTEQLLAREIGREESTVLVRPELVVEVAFNEVQRSNQYPAGMALRFARIKRYRLDKSPHDADTLATVNRIFLARQQVMLNA